MASHMVTVAEIGLSFVHEMRNTGPQKTAAAKKKDQTNKQNINTISKYNLF